MARSAAAVIVSSSVAELFVVGLSVTPAGAVTVAVLIRWPVAEGATVPVTVNVAVPPASRFTVVEMLPLTGPAVQLEPAEATQVHEAPVNTAGNVSLTEAAVTLDGPLLVTTIV